MGDLAFRIEPKELKDYSREVVRLAKKFRYATGMMLNNFAFGSREEAGRLLHRMLIVRDTRFMKRQLRVTKTRLSTSSALQASLFGSMEADRFTGWREQEFGGKKKNTVMTSARVGNSKKRKMRGKARMKPSVTFRTPEERNISGGGANHRAVVFLQKLARENYRQPFIITGKEKTIKLRPGLYKFGRGRAPNQKLILLQTFGQQRRSIRRKKWMSVSTGNYMRRVDMAMEWKKVWKRQLFRGKRKR